MIPLEIGHALPGAVEPGGEPLGWMTPLYLLIALILVLLNGFFVLAEFAIVKVRASRIEELVQQGHARASVAQEMVHRLDAYLSATQLGITVASLGLGWVGEPAFAALVNAVVGLPAWWSPATGRAISAAVAFVIITFLHILVGELAPKSLAIRRAEQCAMAVAIPMRWVYRVFYLPMVVLNGASNLILRMIGLETAHPAEVAHTEHELRMLLSTAQTSGRFPLNRLLVLENIFDLGTQTVREAMIPWSQVQHLPRSATREEVMRVLAESRYSRYPVIDPATGTPTSYLLLKDLIVRPADNADWRSLLRPLRIVRPEDRLEATMQQLQREGANMAVVMEGDRPIGLIALEDILEEIVGRIEDEFPRLPRLYLKDALQSGGIVSELQARTPQQAIEEMAAVIPAANLPAGAGVAALALAREGQMPTDIGHGVAIPHARCPGLAKPVLVLGRSPDGIVFNEKSPEPVHLVFFLLTPTERPHLQVFFLAQLASVAASELVRERLARARSAQELLDIITAADPAVTG
jgi:CBS domain containing-hemolysin-like protein/mannitol/fructose-specific phosphotransferase system IIA component (Ntr-type)